MLLAVNKCESPDQGLMLAADFWQLGLGEPYPVSGIHGNGTGELLDELINHLPPASEITEDEEIKISIIGRPNVGKSSLLNSFAGEERAIVSPISGTTRDAIDTFIKKDEQVYRLIDTAGIRKKKNIDYGTEFFSINRAFKAIRRSDVVLFVIDALDGITDQDQKLAGRIIDEGRACITVVNKWDAYEKDSYSVYDYQKYLSGRLHFSGWSETIFVSALTGQRVPKILDLVNLAIEQHRRRVSTSVRWHSPPASRSGKQGRIYYGTQVSTRPPTIALFVNEAKRFNDNYRRYIERQFREQLGFRGTPIRLLWRSKKVRDAENVTTNRATKVWG